MTSAGDIAVLRDAQPLSGYCRRTRRTSGQILLVREHKQQTVLHLPIAQYTVELLLGLVYALPVLTVDDEHEALRAGVVVPPEGPNLVLSSDIPDVELDVLVCDGFDIESDWVCRWSGSDMCLHAAGVIPVGIVVTDWLSLSL